MSGNVSFSMRAFGKRAGPMRESQAGPKFPAVPLFTFSVVSYSSTELRGIEVTLCVA